MVVEWVALWPILRCSHDRRDEREEDSGGTHCGAKRRRRNSLDKIWMKYRGKQGGCNRKGVKYSRSKE